MASFHTQTYTVSNTWHIDHGTSAHHSHSHHHRHSEGVSTSVTCSALRRTFRFQNGSGCIYVCTLPVTIRASILCVVFRVLPYTVIPHLKGRRRCRRRPCWCCCCQCGVVALLTRRCRRVRVKQFVALYKNKERNRSGAVLSINASTSMMYTTNTHGMYTTYAMSGSWLWGYREGGWILCRCHEWVHMSIAYNV